MKPPAARFLAQQGIPGELADIREPILIVDWLFRSLLGAVIVLALLLGAIWIRRYRRRLAERPAGPPPLPPAEWARQALDRLADEEQRYSDKDYIVAVSDVVREYLERAFDLPAPERTTDEFLAEIGNHPVFTPGMRGEMAAFLQRADLVKFAGQQLSREERPKLLENARSFISTAEHSEPLKPEDAA